MSGTMWTKICGIRDLETARRVRELEPDAIGLNFYRQTVRAVDVAVAASIAGEMPASVETVGLFVNHSLDEIAAIAGDVPLSLLQLHGDESPEFLEELQARVAIPVMRAWRVGAEGLAPLASYVAECRARSVSLAAVLVDARVKGAYGGTGHTAPWDILREEYPRDEWPRLVLAGGLTAENVAEAIGQVAPWGVDVSSGVEVTAGEKDLDLCRRFLAEARNAFLELEQGAGGDRLTL